MTQTIRNVISRATLLTVAAVCLFGGWKCCTAAHRIFADERVRHLANPQPRAGGGWVLPGAVGVGLMAIGGIAALGGVLPLRVIHKIPPTAPRLHDNPEIGPIQNF